MLRRIKEESEDEDEPSSSSKTSSDALEEFRAQWVDELKGQAVKKPEIIIPSDPDLEAKELFLKGVQFEQTGKMVEAIRYYRRALLLVPDIESKVYMGQLNQPVQDVSKAIDYNDPPNAENLISEFEHLDVNCYGFCQPLFAVKSAHLSCLPTEVIDYIIRWVVSSDLDLKSLCNLSRVCKGFFALSEKPDLWKRICWRIWGSNCGPPNWHGFSSWKDMFIYRPHVLYHGCYISKTSYFRQGENSFQDTEYQPWHIVEYFRLFRFFSDGTVLIMTTSEELPLAVTHLRFKNAKQPNILRGYYKLIGNRVVVNVHKITKVPLGIPGPRGRRIKKEVFETKEQFNEMEFELKPTGKKLNLQLSWVLYHTRMVYSKGHEVETDFDVVPSKFPNLHFSRVKSYMLEAEAPL
ncbi:F-box only protein 9-like [Artemia franciscana]|uniref:F-box domain-containing protein n=1 Tax=Artemia franciscana TaxID=6661 RepID=A0AA88HQS3_ARTSF|nr:hypothetical protein QYM36_012642 [Artemia franciscana]